MAFELRRNASPVPALAPHRGDVFPAALLTLTIVLQWFAPLTVPALRYDRTAVAAGEVWRLVTGNLVHLNWPHLALNLAGLVLIWVLFARGWSLRLWCGAFLAGALAVGAGLFLFDPRLQWYVGLSGVLHALFAVGVLVEPGFRPWERAVLLAALAAKIAWEQVVGPTPGVAALIDGAVVVQAHLYGAVGGLVFGIAVRAARPGAAR